MPHSPDNVVKVSEIEGTKVDQVAIGSCTNSSLRDLMVVAGALKGRTVHPSVSLVISPGSRQVFEMIARNGALAELISAGARLLESACGPCIGMGQSPKTNAVSIRTFQPQFRGSKRHRERSGLPCRAGSRGGSRHIRRDYRSAQAGRAACISNRRKATSPMTEW